jgi:hypothetical protein
VPPDDILVAADRTARAAPDVVYAVGGDLARPKVFR